ncbi:plasmid pRiA4b ORF-3 family protein [Glutamicibacter sp. AOP5-A2-18]|uniref:plasmid pRiA4b ORF-3 family protein n=1 Tax=Glutamicibacter sp. AOP5-A2-18 TaxID=3457656 RepID=UPI004033C9BD
MAKKKKKQKPKQGHPARLQGDVVSIERAKVKRGLDALAVQFTQWLETRHGDNELAPMVLAVVTETLSSYAEAIELRSVTDFDPPKLFTVLTATIEFEEAEEPDDDSGELRDLVFTAWTVYLDFLIESDLWAGDPASLEWLLAAIDADDPFDDEDAKKSLDVPETAEAAVAEIVQMPVSKMGRVLLAWATTTGHDYWAAGPGPEYVSQAAHAVRGLFPKDLDSTSRHYVVTVLLSALEFAEALDIKTAALPELGSTSHDLIVPDGATSFESNYTYLKAILDLLLAQPVQEDEESLESWGLANLWLLEAIDSEAHSVAAARDEMFSEVAWAGAHQRMELLRALGLVSEGSTYDIPGIVRLALTDLDNEEQDEEPASQAVVDPFGFSLDDEQEPKREKRTEPYTGKVLQLKLSLRDVKPPIWRRVLVPVDLNLGDLHDIIQISFDWSDSHLHQFYGQNRKISYGPQNSYMESDHDESTVLLSKLFKKPKDRLSYTYDFGDDWRVGIEVEDVLKSDDGQLPRCIGGRRMGPLEDSGGPLNWSEMVQELKVEVPLTMMQDVIPEDAALEPGEDFDPAVFSIEGINENLDLEF